MFTSAEAAARSAQRFYRDTVAPRLAGLPYLNPRLDVEAVGFRAWHAQWLGCLVTPWSINLMLLPRDGHEWRALPVGEKRREQFPAGEFEFVCAIDEGLGEHHDCSLFSPTLEFVDQTAARHAALAALAALEGLDGLASFPLDSDASETGGRERNSRRRFLRSWVGSPDGH